jgi:hypothetical protein
MTHKERINICNQCSNREFSSSVGLICGLTRKRPDFQDNCPDYKEDSAAKKMKSLSKESARIEENSGLSRGRFALFFIAAAQFIMVIYHFSSESWPLILLLLDLIIATVFVVLGFVSFKKPLLAFTLGLGLYVLLIIVVGVIEPISVFRGIIIKIAVISALIYAAINAKEKINKSKPNEIDLIGSE